MTGETTYSVSFYSDSLNKSKHDCLMKKAISIRKLKNELSETICKNPSSIINVTKFDFLKQYNTQVEGLVGREIQPLLTDVYTKYQNKLDQLNNKISFHVQDKIETTFYKKDTKKNNKGDLKEFDVKFKKTELSKALTYFAKYYNKGLVDYMMKELDNIDTRKTEGQLKLYRSVLHYINKFGDKFFKLANARRTRVIKETFSRPIEFRKLTFSAINTIELIAENSNKNSKITHFITLGGYQGITKSGSLDIPIKYNKNYHGDLELFKKGQTPYLVQFVKEKVRFVLTKSAIRTYKDDGQNILGVDTNIKHNLFSTSNNVIIDFDRDKLRNFVKTMLKFDKIHDFLYKTNDEDLTPKQLKKKNKILQRIDAWDRNLNGHYIDKTHELLVVAKHDHKNHLSVEDLCLSNSTWFRSDEFFNIKYSRLVKMLHLSNFKHIIENQCYNNGIQLTIVPSYYTSQRCHVCGYTHEDNRLTQEDFKCLHCGWEGNADYNASENIKQYVEIDVLRLQLLKTDPVTGWFVSKVNSKKVARKILDDYFENNKHSYDAGESSLEYVDDKGRDFLKFHQNS